VAVGTSHTVCLGRVGLRSHRPKLEIALELERIALEDEYFEIDFDLSMINRITISQRMPEPV